MRPRSPLVALALLVTACAHALRPAGAPNDGPYDVVLSGGRIVDGTGSPWFYGDVALRGDRIARITPAGMLANAPARSRACRRG